MDAFAVSITKGMTLKNINKKQDHNTLNKIERAMMVVVLTEIKTQILEIIDIILQTKTIVSKDKETTKIETIKMVNNGKAIILIISLVKTLVLWWITDLLIQIINLGNVQYLKVKTASINVLQLTTLNQWLQQVQLEHLQTRKKMVKDLKKKGNILNVIY